MSKKYTYEYVYNYFKEQGCELIETEYLNAYQQLNYICLCGNKSRINFNNFKNANKKCINCGIKKRSETRRNKHEFVYNFYKQNNYTMTSIYNGNKNKDELICPVGHEIKMSFSNFKNHNQRCNICYRENNFGLNNPRYKSNRESISLNKRLRIKNYSKSWIIKNMKDDLNYNKFLNSPNEFVIDHIIPVKIFGELFEEYNLDENIIKKIINQRDNLQLLTREENSKKSDKGDPFQATQFLINNGIDILKFEITQ